MAAIMHPPKPPHRFVDRNDGHGPQYGCTWTKCGNPNAAKACPFTKDDALNSARPAPDIKAKCKHFWQQHFTRDGGYALAPSGLFCGYCLETRPDITTG